MTESLRDLTAEIGAERRRLENRIRVGCADLTRRLPPERLEDLLPALQATLEFWQGEVQDI